MKNWIKENWLGLVAILFLLILLVFSGSKNSGTNGKWQAIYYPDGCLNCEDNYIYSPFYDTVNECIQWVNDKAETRRGNTDAAECAFDCKKDSGFLVCEETVDVLGRASY